MEAFPWSVGYSLQGLTQWTSLAWLLRSHRLPADARGHDAHERSQHAPLQGQREAERRG